MGETELKNVLRREGEAQARGFWQTAEAAVATRRAEIDAACTRLRADTDRRLQAETAQRRDTLLFAAKTRAMECRLHAEQALEARLLTLAGALLPELAGVDRSRVWGALRTELPPAEWVVVEVHPDDRDQASQAFPDATIESDPALGGGLIATSHDGSIRIDNSLACRLRRAWPDLLPKLLGELRKRVNSHATVETDTTG